MKDVDSAAILAWATGIWGAIVGYLRGRDDAHPLGALSLVLHCVTASFAAWLTWLACIALDVGPEWVPVYTGLAGYLGVESIRPLEARLTGLFGRESD